jgi:hypothetical protein
LAKSKTTAAYFPPNHFTGKQIPLCWNCRNLVYQPALFLHKLGILRNNKCWKLMDTFRTIANQHCLCNLHFNTFVLIWHTFF